MVFNRASRGQILGGRKQLEIGSSRRERAGNKRGGWYWRAYHKRAGKLRRIYLGRSEEMTLERLSAVATRLAGQGEVVEHEHARTRQVRQGHAEAPEKHSPRSSAGLSLHPTERGASTQVVRRPSSTLPSLLTPLVGREREVMAACTLLSHAAMRELTLTGTGWVGKTRLALAIATEVQGNFPDGVCFVSLAPIQDADLVLPTLVGAGQAVWLEQLEREYANLRAALQWMLEQHEHEMALRLSGALYPLWEGHGHLHEGRDFLERALASSQSVPAQVRARALHATGFLVLSQGDLERGAVLGQEAVALHRELGDTRHLAWSLFLLEYITWVRGSFRAAHSYAEEGLAVARDGDKKVTLAYLLDLLGQIAFDQGEDTRARALLEEGLTLHRETGDTRGSLNTLTSLKRVLAASG